MWQNLIDTLDKLGEVYDKLAALGEKKRSALVTINMEALAKVLDEEQLLAAKIQRLEKKRGELLTNLSKTDITINEATKAKDFYRLAPNLAVEKRLIQLHERLGRNVDRALAIRDNNQILAQCALNAVQVQLNKIGGATIEPTYGSKGGGVVTHKKNFDFKA
ncbi:MAG: flagellar protein FlgN [Selenomonadaceae bacterium]|nr:flagellar protein FlgN [Selenomonadaceae bacterium]